eukprot:3720903-Pyramimonas_sp.AAC.1
MLCGHLRPSWGLLEASWTRLCHGEGIITAFGQSLPDISPTKSRSLNISVCSNVVASDRGTRQCCPSGAPQKSLVWTLVC